MVTTGDKYLKKCPFCAFTHPHVVIHPPDGKEFFRPRYSVLCHYGDGGCGADGGWRTTAAEAIDAWNQRKRKYKEE